MKQRGLVVAASIAVFLLTFIIAKNPVGNTGLLILDSDSLEIEIGSADVDETAVLLNWKTNKEAFSMLTFNGERTAFRPATEFSKKLVGLNPGTKYEYTVRACTTEACEEKNALFSTSSNGVPVTGAVINIENLSQKAKASTGYIIYALLAVGILGIARAGYQSIKNRDPMEGIIKNAEEHLENEDYQEAYKQYKTARHAFGLLEEEAKLKHYDKLINIYRSLKQVAEIRQAQQLADKYSKGTIGQDELRKLGEMLSR